MSFEQLRHEDQQRDLYETLRKRRLPRYSTELLALRKRQALLAKAKHYIEAERVKEEADYQEELELEVSLCCAPLVVSHAPSV